MEQESNPCSDEPTARQLHIGRTLKEARERRGYKLRDVEQRLTDLGCRMSASHLSRIENAVAEVGVRELERLCQVLEVPTDAIWTPGKIPWHTVRGNTSEKVLQEVIRGEREITKYEPTHQLLIKKGVYRYVPLDRSLSDPGELEGTLKPIMQGYLFDAGRISRRDMELPGALGQHEGEELIFVLEGELEFWFKQTLDEPTRTLRLEEGDCLHFSSQLLHGFSATGEQANTRALFIYAQPPVTETTKHVELGKGRDKHG